MRCGYVKLSKRFARPWHRGMHPGTTVPAVTRDRCVHFYNTPALPAQGVLARKAPVSAQLLQKVMCGMSLAVGALPSISPQRAVLKGIGLTVGACVLFALLDSGTKLAGQFLPMLLVVWLRFMAQALVTTAVVVPRHGWQAWRTAHPKLQLARALSGLTATVFIFYCLQSMPLANFTALWAAVPLCVVVASACLFGEKVSPARWLLLVVGLGAVIAIARPQQGGMPLGWLVLAPVGVLLSGTLYQLLGSRLARLDHPTTTQLYSTWIPVALTAALLPWIWQPIPHWQVWAAVAVMGLCSGLGHLFLLHAYSYATPSVVSPFLYSQIGFAMLMGWLFFGQIPDTISLVGMAVIMGCGLISLWMSVRMRC